MRKEIKNILQAYRIIKNEVYRIDDFKPDETKNNVINKIDEFANRLQSKSPILYWVLHTTFLLENKPYRINDILKIIENKCKKIPLRTYYNYLDKIYQEFENQLVSGEKTGEKCA